MGTSDMGMDVFGQKPTAPRGEYFRASISQRPLLVKVITTLWSPCKRWETNYGDGLTGPQALALAEALERRLQAGEVAFAFCDVTINSNVELPVVAEIEAWAQSQGFEILRPHEQVIDESFVADFAAFCTNVRWIFNLVAVLIRRDH
jgi:hypothetical protein